MKHDCGQYGVGEICHRPVDRRDRHVVRPKNWREVEVRDGEHRPGDHDGDRKAEPLLERALHVSAKRRLLDDTSNWRRREKQREHRESRNVREVRQLLLWQHDEPVRDAKCEHQRDDPEPAGKQRVCPHAA